MTRSSHQVEHLAGNTHELFSRVLGLTVAELALHVGMTPDKIECIEEGGTEPTVTLLRSLAAALDADVRISPGDELGSMEFEAHAA
jgi:transcriptional regulator with XRE-family HTH domain